MDLTLVNYIRQLLQMGYDINAVRNRLINAGYDVGLIDEAINYIYQQSPGEAPKPSFIDNFKSKKFLVAVASITLLIAVVFGIFTLLGGEPEPIDIYIYLDSTEVFQGEDLRFAKSLVNVEGPGTISLQYEIIDQITGNTAASSQESFSAEAIKRETSITIPGDTSAGSYILQVIARYGEQKIEKTVSFAVLEKIEELEEEEPEQEETPFEPLEEEREEEEPTELDHDNDGLPDITDPDDDNDGIPDEEDSLPLDHDNDGLPDITDEDIDDDGILNKFDNYHYDRDNDGTPDIDDTDNDNDGIPDAEDTYPFDYDNDGVDDKNDDPTGRMYSFPPEQERAELSSKCTNNIECNDYDICTIDTCVEGFCEHAAQSPCCGNFICESSETPDSCSQDCRKATIATSTEAQDMLDEIMAVAETNPEAAAARCEAIEITFDSDNCYSELAKKTSNSAFCERVYKQDARDKCYMYFVMSQDQFQLCDKIEKRLLRNSCFSIKNLKSMQ